MKLSSKELKRKSREILTGQYNIPMLAFTIAALINLFINSPFQISLQNNPGTFQFIIFLLASLITSLLTTVLNGGQIYIHLNLARKKDVQIADLFYFFTRRPDRFILAGLLQLGIFLPVMLPAILCINMTFTQKNPSLYFISALLCGVTMIPVIILSLTYHLIFYLLIDRPDDRVIDFFRESRHLMHGQKGRLFYLQLSFIGMTLLAICSFGIGFLWVGPYQNQTLASFYQNVANEL